MKIDPRTGCARPTVAATPSRRKAGLAVVVAVLSIAGPALAISPNATAAPAAASCSTLQNQLRSAQAQLRNGDTDRALAIQRVNEIEGQLRSQRCPGW